MRRFLPMPEKMLECWSYDPVTGQIWWKTPNGPRSSGRPGELVHTRILFTGRSTRPYLIVSFGKRKYLAHRVAWFLMTKEDPPCYVDHIDNSDTLNNSFQNLRLANDSQNQANAKAHGNRGLPKGVWAALWIVGG